MKTTNYEISKQLAEAGFETYTEFYYVADAKCISQGNDAEDYELVHMDCGYMQKLKYCFNYPAYDLETLLEALPKNIITYPDEKITEQPIEKLRLEMDEIGYYFSDKDDYGRDNCFTYLHREESESLADCAAKMWLKLKKENLI